MKPWWFITYAEDAPTRTRPIVANTITQLHPVTWLQRYEMQLQDTAGKSVHLLFFQRLKGFEPTAAQCEAYCFDRVM